MCTKPKQRYPYKLLIFKKKYVTIYIEVIIKNTKNTVKQKKKKVHYFFLVF